MLKKRSIQPDIWRDQDFGNLSEFAQLVYIGLITLSDDEGRQIGHPSAICSALFPYKGVLLLEEITDALGEIALKMKNILFYENNGQLYIQFTKWFTHQYIRDDRAQKSLFPPPPTKKDVCCSYSAFENLRKQLEDMGIVKKTKLL